MKSGEAEIEEVAKQIVDAAIQIHKALGPGLLESAYQRCLAYEMRKRGFKVVCEVELPVVYDGQMIEPGYRLDMLVADCVIVENKTVESILPVHKAQVMTYLKMRECKLGFLLNWRTDLMKNGIHRIANRYFPS